MSHLDVCFSFTFLCSELRLLLQVLNLILISYFIVSQEIHRINSLKCSGTVILASINLVFQIINIFLRSYINQTFHVIPSSFFFILL